LTPPNDESAQIPPRVSVVVVSHDQSAWLRRCLASLYRSDGRDRLQIIVVDIGSSDDIASVAVEFPEVQWNRLPKDFGLTKAWNIGWRAADAEYVFFLHADTEVEPGAVARLADTLDAHADAMAVCPLLVDEAGKPAPQLGNLPMDGNWRPAQPSGEEPVSVEYARSAAIMTRVFYIKALRKIDERYGQLGADAELAMQIRKSARKILLVPCARVRHEGRAAYTTVERADLLLGRAAFIGKYQGAVAGFKARLAAIFGPLLGFRLGAVKYTIVGQKIDGAQ
jgi:GT2 family glycosyltransferase